MLLLLLFFFVSSVHAQIWQWSVAVDSVVSGETKDHPQAYLWIPENCGQVKAVVFAQHNMVEEGMLEHQLFRKTMQELGIAEVWVTPGINMPFDFTKDAGEDFSYMMKLLADVSGYKELEHAPIIPLGHSAYATFPWNFAAWNPGRTLALVSVHGDAPQTNLTGYGGANVDWGNRNIDGVPSLFIMGEYEWWEDRIKPAFEYSAKHPNSVVSLFCDAGHGHFDYSDEMIGYVCMFIKKAAAKRLPKSMSVDKPNVLIPVKPQQGWLMDRWHKDSLPMAIAAPYALYKGNRQFASWIFDRQMADATEKFYAAARGKKVRHTGFMQNGEILQPVKTHANYQLKFIPLEDGISFKLRAFFADTSRIKPVAEFAKTPLLIDRICGPVKKINDTTFQISFNRLGFNNPKRSNDIWLLAHNKGDDQYKSSVQQLNMRFPLFNKEGVEQQIEFPQIQNQKAGIKQVRLKAVSSAGARVSYYVKAGPAFVRDQQLRFTKIPPRAKFPVKITVVAWQYGVAGKLQSAKPIEQSFFINK
ncbi:hypothetical protein [Terrimonas alba]|uniref:hypothetical protein n=1 Tax=Terrimonas alba TaxID=3349636 RepID=UPI0035F38E5D